MRGPLPGSVAGRYPHGYAVVDVETTGLRPSSDRVLQVAVASVAPDGHLESTWSTLLDPGCDPGPTHVHGITKTDLVGAPRYDDVAHHVRGLLAGRVLVAHNAQFDWGFLSAEATRGGAPLDVQHRLCTLALTRRLDLPLPDMKLGSVAAYWGVAQQRAHDAADDTRVLVEVLRHSLVVADRLGLRLPLASCVPGDAGPVHPARAPRPACRWKYPGRWTAGAPLVQGMKLVVTGDTQVDRDTLVAAAAAAGLDVMNSASSRTSVLVCDDPACGTRKLAAAHHHGVPVVRSTELMALLTTTTPGTPKPDPAAAAARRATTRATAPSAAVRPSRPTGPLAGRRVLILGGPHPVAAEVRERVTAAGGQAAANLTASVTDVVALPGAQRDRRWSTASAAGLVVLDPDTLAPTTAAPQALPPATTGIGVPATDATAALQEAVVLPRGGVVDLPEATGWSLSVRWPDLGADGPEVDVVALLTDTDEQVGLDEDLVFFNATAHPSGAAELALDVPGEALLELRPARLPDRTEQVLVAAAVGDGVTFGQVGPVELVLRDQDGRTAARATLDAATDEQSLYLATLYQRNGTWRFRAVGQGHEHGLASLVVRHGVDVDED